MIGEMVCLSALLAHGEECRSDCSGRKDRAESAYLGSPNNIRLSNASWS